MSLFGSLMGDVEDDPFFRSHLRQMRHMSSMMNSIFSDPFGMIGESPLAIMGQRSSLMPYMPPMPSLNRLFTADLSNGHMGAGSSFSSSTVVMSSGPNGNPQVYSSTSSTKIGPNGVKETRKTLQDSRTGVKKMSIGHHIGERAHLIEREQNVYSGDAEERQEFINLDEEEAEDFDREFQERSGSQRRARDALALPAPQLALPAPPSPSSAAAALPAPPSPPAAALPAPPAATHSAGAERRRPTPRRPLRAAASPLALPSSGVREVYGGAHPQRRHRHRHRHWAADTNTPNTHN